MVGFCLLLSGTNKTLDFEYFSMETPQHWTYIEQRGIDSFVGSIAIGKGDTLHFDYGNYSNSLTDKEKDHDYIYDTISNLKAKICVPKIIGKGTTGVYFEMVSEKYSGTRLTITGYKLKPENHKAFLGAIKTIKFKVLD